MTSILDITDRLLQVTMKKPLPEFIADQVELGNDATGIQAALMIATGQMYDRRTVVAWIERYSK